MQTVQKIPRYFSPFLYRAERRHCVAIKTFKYDKIRLGCGAALNWLKVSCLFLISSHLPAALWTWTHPSLALWSLVDVEFREFPLWPSSLQRATVSMRIRMDSLWDFSWNESWHWLAIDLERDWTIDIAIKLSWSWKILSFRWIFSICYLCCFFFQLTELTTSMDSHTRKTRRCFHHCLPSSAVIGDSRSLRYRKGEDMLRNCEFSLANGTKLKFCDLVHCEILTW